MCEFCTLQMLMMYAFDIQPFQILDGPSWGQTDGYNTSFPIPSIFFGIEQVQPSVANVSPHRRATADAASVAAGQVSTEIPPRNRTGRFMSW